MIKTDYLKMEIFLKKGIKEMNLLNRNRFKVAGSISERAKIVHEKLLRKINESSPLPLKNRKVYTFPEKYFLELGGCIIKDEEGIKHPLVGFRVGNLRAKINLVTKNTEEKIEEAYFKHVVAHEYGHIIFDFLTSKAKNLINKNLGRTNPYTSFRDLELTCSPEIDEGYAFWFGDYFSGIDTNFQEIGEEYDNLHKSSIFKTYNVLTSLSKAKGIEECFKPNILAESLCDLEKEAEDFRGFPFVRW